MLSINGAGLGGCHQFEAKYDVTPSGVLVVFGTLAAEIDSCARTSHLVWALSLVRKLGTAAIADRHYYRKTRMFAATCSSVAWSVGRQEGLSMPAFCYPTFAGNHYPA